MFVIRCVGRTGVSRERARSDHERPPPYECITTFLCILYPNRFIYIRSVGSSRNSGGPASPRDRPSADATGDPIRESAISRLDDAGFGGRSVRRNRTRTALRTHQAAITLRRECRYQSFEADAPDFVGTIGRKSSLLARSFVR